jgi:hypothetical protein
MNVYYFDQTADPNSLPRGVACCVSNIMPAKSLRLPGHKRGALHELLNSSLVLTAVHPSLRSTWATTRATTKSNVTRMQRGWEAQRAALATVRRFNATLLASPIVATEIHSKLEAVEVADLFSLGHATTGGYRTA